MSYSEPARTTSGRIRIHRTRRIRIRWIRVAGLLAAIAAIAVALGHQLLASSSSTAASPTHVLRSQHRDALGEPPGAPALPGENLGALGEADGAVPDGTTVFNEAVPGVANLDPDLLGALRQAATDAAGDGVEFLVDSGWRSPAYQEQLLQEAVSKYGSVEEAARWVATPTTSAHVSGDAVDIGAADATAWLSGHGAEYGLSDLRQRTLALRTAPRSDRSRLPARVRGPHRRPEDAAMKMSGKPWPLAALAIVAVIGAGCSNEPAENGAAGNAAASREQGVKFAQCMRDNGVSGFPDPDASGGLTIDGVLNGSSLDPNAPVWTAAIGTCKDLQPPGFTGDKNVSAEEQQTRLEFAQCIRENGVKDFPDPVNGEPLVDTNRIPSSATEDGMTILNAAMQTCGDLAEQAIGQ
jgi:hypothetical protein